MKSLQITAILLGPLATLAPVAAGDLYDRSEDPHRFAVFMREGGWCWFQDPRAIIHRDHLIVGSVRGNDSGPALIGVYDLKQGRALETFQAKNNFDRDDHNSPVFHARPDGSVLALYCRHSVEKVHYARISDRRDFTKWGPERVIRHGDFLQGRDNATYMNLYELGDTLYNFYRGYGFDPCFHTSNDDGLTWGNDTHFIESEVPGRQRPYPRYTSDGRDTLHVTFTDAHPRNFGNSIYYAAFRDGKFFRADGGLIKDLAVDGPLKPSEAQLVFKGSGKTGSGKGRSVAQSAWTSSIALDQKGQPHLAYSLHLSNTDHRFRIASWNGKNWIDREVAHAGNCLYENESSYTGLIALDPIDPGFVVISSDVDPTTGKDTGGRHEIFTARVSPADDVSSIKWRALTRDSPVRNIRPCIVRDDHRRIILWNRGVFNTFTDYQLDTVGIITKLEAPPPNP